jgi:hypothetical protein
MQPTEAQRKVDEGEEDGRGEREGIQDESRDKGVARLHTRA